MSNVIKEEKKTISTELDTAPLEIKLAVDLIQLLEENKIAVDTAVKALEIVLQDFKRKELSYLTGSY